MKKKIVITLCIISLIFLAGGAYIIITIEIGTAKLDNLIKLHQVEILREQLLIKIKKVQSDLILANTRYHRSINTVISNVRDLENSTFTCYDCHHDKYVLKRFENLNKEIGEYKNSLSRFLTIRANRKMLMAERDNAFRIGERLEAELNSMVHKALATLYDKTQASIRDISKTKSILYMLVVLTPFIAAGLGFIYIRELTKPVKILLRATRRLRTGDLDYKIEGLTGEFGEVATSFNAMSSSLKMNMHKIRESENRYRTLFESAVDAIFLIEAGGENAGDIVEANIAAARMHGYSVEEMSRLNVRKDLDTPETAKKVKAFTKRMLNGEWVQAEITHRKKDGTVFPVEISAGLLEFMDHRYILAFERDISERKRMEDQILQSKADWEDTFNEMTDTITIHNNDFDIIRANKAAKELLGLPDLEHNNIKCYKYYHGTDYPPEDCRGCEAIRTGKPVAFETFEPHLNIFLEMRVMPRFDSNNQMTGVIHVVRDITERKKVEEALQRTEQMKLVGEWATGLAHEIKNPLAGIKASVEILADDLNIPEEDREIVLQAIDEIKRIEVLLKSLLNFARPSKLELTVTDINDLLDKTIAFSMRHPSLPSNGSTPIEINKEFDEKLPETFADPMQLQQVFLNLLYNAIEGMNNGGRLRVKTLYDADLNSILITIADNGKGMDRETMDNAFKPFFTTKRKGTGLGLAISRRIVEEHGGEIHLESTPGIGTVFKISLRVKEDKKGQII